MGLVVVTGIGPRTGTSFIMQQAKKAGLPIAGKKFIEGWTVPKHNKKGYWELDPSEPMDLDKLQNKVVKLWNPTLKLFPLDQINRIIVLERQDKKEQRRSIAKVVRDEINLKYAGQSLETTDPDLILQRSIKGMGMWLLGIKPKSIMHVYTELIDSNLKDIITFMKGGLLWV